MTTNNRKKMTKRTEIIKQNNAKRKDESKSKLLQLTTNTNNILNQKAIECISILKDTKDKNNQLFTSNLHQLATIIAQSKLKNINNNNDRYREEVAQLKKEVTQLTYYSHDNYNGLSLRDIYLQQLNDLYMLVYSDDGDLIIKCKDNDRERQLLTRLENLSMPDGEDLIQDIELQLWLYIHKALQDVSYNYDRLSTTCLLDCFAMTKLQSTTYRNGHLKPVELWEQAYTNAIKECLKTVSRIVDSKKTIKDNTIAYESVETTVYSPFEDTEQTYTRYRQVPQIAITDTMDSNNNPFAQTADIATIGLIDKIVTTTNFTRNQLYIFKMHICNNCSIIEIADKLQVRTCYVEKELVKIKQKIIDTGILKGLGYTDDKLPNKAQISKKIACYDVVNSENKIFVANFDSIGKASKALLIDKGNISKVLKGILKQTGGFYFEYVDN